MPPPPSRAEGGGPAVELDAGWDVGGGIPNGGYLLPVTGRVRQVPAPGWCLVGARASEMAGGWVEEDHRIGAPPAGWPRRAASSPARLADDQET